MKDGKPTLAKDYLVGDNSEDLHKSSTGDITDYGHPIANVNVESLDYFIGQLFQQTELLGLPERQGGAFKSIVRDMFWKWYNNHLPNPTGLADPSHQARVRAGIDKA